VRDDEVAGTLTEILVNVTCIHPVQDNDHWQAFVREVMKHLFP
jgi:hypothetical protein